MRLFGKVDGQINRFDRAEWMTPPFDGVFAGRKPGAFLGRASSRVAAAGQITVTPSLAGNVSTRLGTDGIIEVFAQ